MVVGIVVMEAVVGLGLRMLGICFSSAGRERLMLRRAPISTSLGASEEWSRP